MRGRPKQSRIRERITAIINKVGLSYGYEIYKLYRDVFGDITSRIIYYNLKMGVELGELNIIEIKKEMGLYSWGEQSERIYYTPGPYAILKKEDLDSINKLNYSSKKINYDCENEIQKHYRDLKEKIKSSNNNDNFKLRNKCDKLIDYCKIKLKNPEEYINKIQLIKNYLE